MTNEELELINDSDELMRYEHNIYRFVGMLGMEYIFADILTNNVIALSRNTILAKGKIAFRKNFSNL